MPFRDNIVQLDIYFSGLKYESIQQIKAYETMNFLSTYTKIIVLHHYGRVGYKPFQYHSQREFISCCIGVVK